MVEAVPHPVMPGLVPGISLGAGTAAEMDARNESGHDGGGVRARRARGGTGRACPPPEGPVS